MGIRKVSNTKNDLQGHSRSLILVPFDRPYMISCGENDWVILIRDAKYR